MTIYSNNLLYIMILQKTFVFVSRTSFHYRTLCCKMINKSILYLCTLNSCNTIIKREESHSHFNFTHYLTHVSVIVHYTDFLFTCPPSERGQRSWNSYSKAVTELFGLWEKHQVHHFTITSGQSDTSSM